MKSNVAERFSAFFRLLSFVSDLFRQLGMRQQAESLPMKSFDVLMMFGVLLSLFYGG